MSTTVRQIVEILLGAVPGDRPGDTVDTLKCGDPEMPVTGIASCFLCTQEVARQAVARGANLILTHEPVYYNHRDERESLAGDPVVQAKREYFEQHGLAVFRYHDFWHRTVPDGILTGMVRRLGWERWQNGAGSHFFTLPAISTRALAAVIKERLGIGYVRATGELDAAVTRVCLHPGFGGYTHLPRLLQTEDTELLIVGETHEWETPEYVRDAATQGRRKALVVLGHAASEEAGMVYLLEWLRPQLPEAIALHHIPSGSPLEWL
ncbi:MAG: Nif3-like dinuclear metal center hexameric protein [Planctomycetota bacterium]